MKNSTYFEIPNLVYDSHFSPVNRPKIYCWWKNKTAGKFVATSLENIFPMKTKSWIYPLVQRHVIVKIINEYEYESAPQSQKYWRGRDTEPIGHLFNNKWSTRMELMTNDLQQTVSQNIYIDWLKEIQIVPVMDTIKGKPTLNNEMTFWKLVEHAKIYLSQVPYTEKLKTEVISYFKTHSLDYHWF